MRFALLLSCALCAAACAGTGDRPPQDPTAIVPPPDATVTVTSSSAAAAAPNLSMSSPAASGTPSASPTARAASSESGPSVPTTTPPEYTPMKGAENTGINARDRQGALTPLSQGNSADEIKITASIRRGVMGDRSLSFTAKNVKIITTGTRVTLRGPVESAHEKASIEFRASQTPGVTQVDDQLEITK
jgi:hypothetical protein